MTDNSALPEIGAVVERLRGLSEKATPAPWNHLGFCGQDGVIQGPRQIPVATAIAGKSSGHTGHQAFHDAALIVALRNNIESILDQRETSEKHRNDLADTIQDQLTEIGALKARIEELHHEAEIFDADHADKNRMVDRIADLIGVPHDQELDTTAFELWFSAQHDERASDKALLSETTRERDEARARVINSPETADFMAGVPIEAAHQRERWGVDHDAGKSPFDWFWLIGFLSQKAADAAVRGDVEKAKHHTISTAAALANWHAALSGKDNRFQPGITPKPAGMTV